MKPRLQNSSKVNFDSDAPKGAMGLQWKNRASNLNFQLFTLSVLKLVVLWATNIESGSSDWAPKKELFPSCLSH